VDYVKKVLVAAGLLLLPFALPSHASEISISECIAFDEPRADTDQMQRLNEYLIWRGFDLEPSLIPAYIQIRKDRRILLYYLTGASRPTYNGAYIHAFPIEIHQFSNSAQAKSFSPYETLLADDPVDLHGPGVLDKYLALQTQTHWNKNLVLFMQIYPDDRMAPEDLAAAAQVKDKFIRAFLEFSDQAYEEERRVQDALSKVRQAIELEGAEGQAILLELLDDYDQTYYARRLNPHERAELDRRLKEMISRWQSAIRLADEVLRQPTDAPAWVEPQTNRLPLLIELSESEALLPFHRAIEKAAIDLMYRYAIDFTPGDDDPERKAIHDSLRAEMESGQLREQWKIRNWPPDFELEEVRFFSPLAGVIVSSVIVPRSDSVAEHVADTILFRNTIPMMSPLFSNKPLIQPEEAARDAYAVYLRKRGGRWELRRIIPLRDAGWLRESSDR